MYFEDEKIQIRIRAAEIVYSNEFFYIPLTVLERKKNMKLFRIF